MRILTRARRHACVYWGKPAHDGFKVVHQLPVECKCRWDDGMEEADILKNQQDMARATALMDRLVDLGGFLWHGTLAELRARYGEEGIANPLQVEGAYEIKRTEVVPELRNRDHSNPKKTAIWAYM